MDQKTKEYFAGWPGVEHIPYTGDYHVDGKKRLALEKIAEEVAEAQSSRGKDLPPRPSSSTGS